MNSELFILHSVPMLDDTGSRLYAGTFIILHYLLNPTSLWRSAAIVRNGRDVFDGQNIYPVGVKTANRPFPAAADAFDKHADLFYRVRLDIVRHFLYHLSGGVWGGLFRTLKTDHTGARPAQHITILVSHRDNGIVKSGLNISAGMAHLAFDFFLFGFFYCFYHIICRFGYS